MPNNSSSKKTKTIRMDKKQFAIMMFLTPAFAAVVSVLLVLMVFMPFTKTNSTPVEVPTLGSVAKEDSEEEKTVETESTTPAENTEIIVKTEIPATNTKVEEKKSTNTTTTKKTSSNKATNNTSKTTTTTKTSTNTSTNNQSTQNPTTPSAKEVCEARTDGPKTHIVVIKVPAYDYDWILDIHGIENPLVYYEKRVSDTPAKMVYNNNTCTPVETSDFKRVEDEILAEGDLEKYGVTNKTYDIWK